VIVLNKVCGHSCGGCGSEWLGLVCRPCLLSDEAC
jgi:hypothetical protein